MPCTPDSKPIRLSHRKKIKPTDIYPDYRRTKLNRKRAARIDRIIYLMDEVHADYKDAPRDIITDLMHWFTQHGLDPDNEIASAVSNFNDEITGKE